MNVLLVSTWETACGIAEHSAMLKEAVEQANPDIDIRPTPEGLDPAALEGLPVSVDLLHLNYHAALHSRWTPAAIARVKSLGIPTLVTYHDTGVPNSDQCKAVCAAANYTVVHEPFDDLPENVEYIRMGVPALTDQEEHLGRERWAKQYRHQPILGTVGFPFPWKNYDELAKVTAQCGWGLYLIAPNATAEQLTRWRSLNPYTTIRSDFVKRDAVVRLLHQCDATAFMYTCANTGQSGAILQGIAARKPVIALSTCRQMRALYADSLGQQAIMWAQTFTDVTTCLQNLTIGRVDAGMVALAEQDSWAHVGERYASIYRRLGGAA